MSLTEWRESLPAEVRRRYWVVATLSMGWDLKRLWKDWA